MTEAIMEMTAVREAKAGKIEFKVDKTGNINSAIGKLSFKEESLVENLKTLIHAINRAKPSSSKGIYLRSMYISSTMGPGVRIDAAGASKTFLAAA